jgi:hypothetical protein
MRCSRSPNTPESPPSTHKYSQAPPSTHKYSQAPPSTPQTKQQKRATNFPRSMRPACRGSARAQCGAHIATWHVGVAGETAAAASRSRARCAAQHANAPTSAPGLGSPLPASAPGLGLLLSTSAPGPAGHTDDGGTGPHPVHEDVRLGREDLRMQVAAHTDAGRGEPSPGADVDRVSPVPAQMWAG